MVLREFDSKTVDAPSNYSDKPIKVVDMVNVVNASEPHMRCNICGQSVMTCMKVEVVFLPNGEPAHKDCYEYVTESRKDGWEDG